MTVAGYDPYVPADHPAWASAERLELDALLASSDVVSIHLPLTPETKGLIGKNALDRMKRDAILINAARGGIMDEAALVEALKAGKLGGAAIDVFAEEPLRGAGKLFADVPNLILTPHIGGVVRASVAASVPELLFGKSRYARGVQVRPESVEVVSKILPPRERPTARSASVFPGESTFGGIVNKSTGPYQSQTA